MAFSLSLTKIVELVLKAGISDFSNANPLAWTAVSAYSWRSAMTLKQDKRYLIG
jgi:hypothetical protein